MTKISHFQKQGEAIVSGGDHGRLRLVNTALAEVREGIVHLGPPAQDWAGGQGCAWSR